jgi:hypothetical protein
MGRFWQLSAFALFQFVRMEGQIPRSEMQKERLSERSFCRMKNTLLTHIAKDTGAQRGVVMSADGQSDINTARH